MNKYLKITLIVVGVLIGVILLDTIQALVFNNNPIIGTQTKCMSKQGLFVTTYHCDNGKNITKFKNSSCNTEDICGIKLEDLENIHNEIRNKLEEYEKTNGKKYINIAATGVDQNLNKVVITLVNNSKEAQIWFRENIYDSKYIAFKQGGPYTTSSNNVSLTVKLNTITNEGATFILKNHTDDEYWYGPEYYIEKKENGKWNEIKTLTGEPLVWNSIAYTLKANEEKELYIDWSIGYGKLESGEYRLIKNTSFREKNTPIDEIQKLNLYAEFKIPVNIVAGTGNTIKVKKTTLQNTNKFNEYLKKDGITIYFASNIEEVYLNLFYRDISNMTLKYYIENINEPIKDAIKDITQYLNREGIYKDGGSTVYRSKEYDITLVKCNNMSGNKDVYIGDYNMNTDGITMCSR